MARHPFGGTASDWTFTVNIDGITPNLAAAASLTMWNAATSGTQITDLTEDSAGLVPISGGIIISSDGTDGFIAGQVEEFFGPDDDTTELWADGGAGGRIKITATDTGSRVAANTLNISNLQNSQANDEALLLLVPVCNVADSGGTYAVRPAVAGARVVFWIGDSTPGTGTGGAVEGDIFIDRTP